MKKLISVLLLSINFTGCGGGNSSNNGSVFEQLSVKEFRDKVEVLDENEILLDIRTLDEFNSGKIKDSKNIDYYKSNFESELDKLDKSQTYYIYCRSGNRSRDTMKKMKDLGFERVYELENGVNSWYQEEYKLI